MKFFFPAILLYSAQAAAQSYQLPPPPPILPLPGNYAPAAPAATGQAAPYGYERPDIASLPDSSSSQQRLPSAEMLYNRNAYAEMPQQQLAVEPDLSYQQSSAMSQPNIGYAADSPGISGYDYQNYQRVEPEKPFYLGFKLEFGELEETQSRSSFGSSFGPTTTTDTTTDFDFGVAPALLAGYRVHENVRLEAELGYRYFAADNEKGTVTRNGVVVETFNEAASGNFKAFTVMANGYLDVPLPLYSSIIPYVGAGIGAMFQYDGAEEQGLAYQLMAGANYKLTPTTFFGAGYKYQIAPDLFEDADGGFDAESHNIEFTIRQHF